jgi:hypothetical protein
LAAIDVGISSGGKRVFIGSKEPTFKVSGTDIRQAGVLNDGLVNIILKIRTANPKRDFLFDL